MNSGCSDLKYIPDLGGIVLLGMHLVGRGTVNTFYTRNSRLS